MAASNELVVLRGGVAVLLPAWQLALALEQRGFRFRVLGGQLEVQPCRELTGADCRAIREHRDELIRIVQYEAPELS
jgi:hypothetical protein